MSHRRADQREADLPAVRVPAEREIDLPGSFLKQAIRRMAQQEPKACGIDRRQRLIEPRQSHPGVVDPHQPYKLPADLQREVVVFQHRHADPLQRLDKRRRADQSPPTPSQELPHIEQILDDDVAAPGRGPVVIEPVDPLEGGQFDPYGRNSAGVPPSKSADYAWVQHMIRSMAPVSGRMAVVLPHGVLFRMGVEGKIRRQILETDLLESVIGLGPNLFYGTGLAACIMVFRQRKDLSHAGKVLFIDASAEFRKRRNQNTLEPEHVEQIFAWYEGFADVERKCQVASLDEIAENDFNLNIPLYVEPVLEDDLPTVPEAIASLRAVLADAYAAEDRLAGATSTLRQNGQRVIVFQSPPGPQRHTGRRICCRHVPRGSFRWTRLQIRNSRSGRSRTCITHALLGWMGRICGWIA